MNDRRQTRGMEGMEAEADDPTDSLRDAIDSNTEYLTVCHGGSAQAE